MLLFCHKLHVQEPDTAATTVQAAHGTRPVNVAPHCAGAQGTSVSGKAVALRLSSRQAPYRWKAVLDAVDTQWQAANLGFTAQDGMPPQGMVYGHIDRSQPLTDDWIPALARAISTGQPQPVTGTQLINGAPVRPQGRGSLLLHIPTERLGLHTGSQDDRLTLTLHTHPPDLNVAKSALKEANEEIDKLNNSKQAWSLPGRLCLAEPDVLTVITV